MRWHGLLAIALGSMGCTLPVGGTADPPDDPPPHDDGGPPEGAHAAAKEVASDYFIHVGGICSVGFSGGKGDGALGSWPSTISIDAPVDQTTSMATAVADLRDVLDAYCTGEAWCYLYGYSNGAAVISKTLSVNDAEAWRLLWVATSAGNEGGSELSASGMATIGHTLGVSCELARHIGPSDHRAGWNHDDTGGHTTYQLGGRNEWWYTGKFPDFFDGMSNDGAVAVHSSAGLREPYFVSDDDPWLCYEPEYHYDQHEVAYSCEGFDEDHYGMKMRGIWELGG